MSGLPLLSVESLSKRYGARIGCADVSFDLEPGEVLAEEVLDAGLEIGASVIGEKGKALAPVLKALYAWGERHG